MWRAQIDEFSRDFQVLAPDTRGLGETSAFVDEPDIETLASDLATLLDFLGINEPIVLCGLSMGGYTALAFARLFPSRLRALVLADTRADADSDEAKTSRDEMIEFAREHGTRAVAHKMSTKLLGETTRRERPEIEENVAEMAAPHTGEALARIIAALRDRRDSTEFFRRFTSRRW
jgi:pimeloyl-ACP methyl ester carboxylesterase